MNLYYFGTHESVTQKLKSDQIRGLTDAEAQNRLLSHGPNTITAKSSRSIFSLIVEQFSNLLVLLLFAAAILSFFLGSFNDGVVLLTIVLLNAIVGFLQDWKSENIVARLGSMVTENAIVVRGGRRIEIPSQNLVPGDMIYLQEGDGIPADCRLIESESVMTNEFALTGESVPTNKDANFYTDTELPLPDRKNYLYFGTSLARGEALAIVCETGDATELGQIAAISQGMIREESPLQKELNILGVKITRFALSLALALFLIQILRDESLKTALIFGVSVAAAMVPEGLPAQISMGLSLGVARLARKKAVVKRLSSVEALGAATVIATDKTGTITKNQMTIKSAFFDGANFRITGTGYDPKGAIYAENDHPLNAENLGDGKILFLAGFLSSTGRVNPPDQYHSDYYALGDPTEAALATMLMKAGFDQDTVLTEYPRVQLFPFDSDRKRITIIREHKGKKIAFVKGSIESILPVCNSQALDGEIKPLTEKERSELLAVSRSYAAQALRVIALAYRDLAPDENPNLESAETNLVFSGFVTMVDPPREEAHTAIAAAHAAGIRTIMITGDHQATARSIAVEVGMQQGLPSEIRVVNQDELIHLSDAEIQEILSARSVVFSRVSPAEKLKLVELLQKNGDVVAVTGDGVNDTLSLKRSDIGVAMGHNGSKIAQEAASLVLLDNSFATIVSAISEGRTIFRNIQTNVVATLSSNFTELLCVLAGFALIPFHMPAVILPIQILLVDLVAEMLPLLMLTYDPSDPAMMRLPPRRKGALLNRSNLRSVLASGLVRGALSVTVYILVYSKNLGSPGGWERAMSSAFVTIVVTQYISVFYLRSTRGLFDRYFFSNPYLFAGIGLSFLAMLAIVHVPILNQLLHTQPLRVFEYQLVAAAVGIFLIFSSLWRKFVGQENAQI
jgi:P-type Ca2+ transporter type 2C